MKRHSIKRIILLFTFSAVLLTLCLFSSSCNKEDCQGCYKEAPWSAPGDNPCFPDRDMCEAELGQDCQRCN